MLKKVVLVLGIAVAAFLTVAAIRPNTFHVERSLGIAASPLDAFALVNDFHKWAGWSPWDKLDPNMQRTFTGAAAGTTAGYSWTGNDKVGEGRMTIVESLPGERIRINLEFIKPWPGQNTLVFVFAPQGGGTQVTWSMDGTNSFIAKAFSMFMDMDSMVGKDFEKGLAQMKALSELEAKRRAEGAASAGPPPAPAEPAIKTQ